MDRPDSDTAAESALYYGDYLQLDRLLDCQKLESARRGEPAHDEMLFIIVHQAYELWFKQIRWELGTVIKLFPGERVDERDIGRAAAHLERVTEIQQVLIRQIDVLETMTPLDFLDFRDLLVPASGFQSLQFRLIENRLGIRPEQRLDINGKEYTARFSEEDRAALRASEEKPSLFERIEAWLGRTPFLEYGRFDFWETYREAVEAMLLGERRLIEENPTLPEDERSDQLSQLESTREQFDALFDPEAYAGLKAEGTFRMSHRAFMAALLINLYRDEPILHGPFRLLSLLMDVDEHFTTWRYRHAMMVLRMIGAKVGTGGSSGHDYLRRTADRYKIFSDLFTLSTFLIPRSKLPALPDEVREAMGFQFGAKS